MDTVRLHACLSLWYRRYPWNSSPGAMSLRGVAGLPLEMAVTPSDLVLERELLEAARGGDEDAFSRIVEEHRTELHAHCYRMLGSLHDAEDALQETLLRAWRGLPGSRDEARSHLALQDRDQRLPGRDRAPAQARAADRLRPAERPEHDPGKPLVESVWVEPYPDETLGSGRLRSTRGALRAARGRRARLHRRAAAPARDAARGAVLREVLGFSAREVSESLETTVASVNSALQRARKAVDDRLPEQSQQETLRSLGDERSASSSRRYVDAGAGDVEALRALLAEDAVFSMPPWAGWWRGRETIAGFAKTAVEVCAAARAVPTRANGQPAIAYYAPGRRDGALSGHRDRRACVRGLADQGDHRLHLPGALCALRPPGGAHSRPGLAHSRCEQRAAEPGVGHVVVVVRAAAPPHLLEEGPRREPGPAPRSSRQVRLVGVARVPREADEAHVVIVFSRPWCARPESASADSGRA